MEKTEEKKNIRKFQGVVKSSAMDKTLVVVVEGVKKHPKYEKYFKKHRSFKVHDPKNQYAQGDAVEFIECRPMSKEKRWRVIYPNSVKK